MAEGQERGIYSVEALVKIATGFTLAFLALSCAAAAGQDLPTQDQPPRPTPLIVGSIGLDGTIDKFENGTKHVVVKAADGIRHVFRLTGRTAVHGANTTAEDVSAGVDVGSHVVVHYVTEGGEKTAVEVDRVGENGLRALQGVVTYVDRGARTLAVHLADGSSMTLHLTERAAKDAGRDVKRTDKVVVYYADEGGKHVAHFFEKVT